MKSVYSVLFWILRVLVLTFAVGLILPHFDNIVLAGGVQNALVVATLFTLIGMGLRHAMKFATAILGGVVGFFVALAGLFVLPAFALMGVAAMLPDVLTVHTFGAAFGAGLVTLVVDLALGICFGLVIAALLLKKAAEAAIVIKAAREAEQKRLQEEGRTIEQDQPAQLPKPDQSPDDSATGGDNSGTNPQDKP